VVVTNVFAAGEAPIDGFDRDALAEGLRARGHRAVTALKNEALLTETIAGIAEDGDLVICLGAGSITQWANDLPTRLAALSAPPHAIRDGQ
jgi:UDP-N-acetylmuramate--alanine ligase